MFLDNLIATSFFTLEEFKTEINKYPEAVLKTSCKDFGKMVYAECHILIIKVLFVLTACKKKLGVFKDFKQSDVESLISLSKLFYNIYQDYNLNIYCDSNQVLPELTIYSNLINIALNKFQALGLEETTPEMLGYIHETFLDNSFVVKDNKLEFSQSIDRKKTGSHFTPITTANEIVKHTIEPLIFKGCREGSPETDWVLVSSKDILNLKICDPAMGGGVFLLSTCRKLSYYLTKAWELENTYGGYNNPTLEAKKLIIKNCLYGVDINPIVVEITKLALWMELECPDNITHVLNLKLKSGDSLIGLTGKQMEELRNQSSKNKKQVKPQPSNMQLTLFQ
jgi:hypothetical protein